MSSALGVIAKNSALHKLVKIFLLFCINSFTFRPMMPSGTFKIDISIKCAVQRAEFNVFGRHFYLTLENPTSNLPSQALRDSIFL
jgi:hypothetical protein